MILALGITTLTSAIYPEYINIHPNPEVETAIIASAGLGLTPIVVVILMWIFNALYFRTMEEHQNWVVHHGIFSDKPNEQSILESAKEKIQTFQKPQACGVADELLKWKSLLDQGVITEEEFSARKEKLLK